MPLLTIARYDSSQRLVSEPQSSELKLTNYPYKLLVPWLHSPPDAAITLAIARRGSSCCWLMAECRRSLLR